MPSDAIEFTPKRDGILDAFPAVAATAGAAWTAWVSFHDRADEVVARRIDPGSLLAKMETVSASPGANFWPRIVMRGDKPQVIWAHHDGDGWQVMSRLRDDSGWGDARILSGDISAWQPCGHVSEDGSLSVAWAGADCGRIFLWRESTGEVEVVADTGHCTRPQLASRAGELIVAWDCCKPVRNGTVSSYDVYTRTLEGDGWEDVQQVSRGSEWEFVPELGVDGDGNVFCCWIAQQDVRDPRGIIDQKHSIRCAQLVSGQWRPAGADQSGDVAELCHGLLAKEAIWGYLGRRREPFLRSDDHGRMWVIWERKREQDGSLGPGMLVGRPLLEEGPPVVLDQGSCYYVMAEERTEDGYWTAMRGDKGAPSWDMTLKRLVLPPLEEIPVTAGDYSEWQPVKLPDDIAPLPRPQPVRFHDAEHSLYFGDLHCHTTLSADAEGEVDELYHYAREKARLDFVALVDNDCYQCPLTASEFAIAATSADLYNDPGRFVALPGYEWTLWDRDNCPHPNHRTVLFPGDSDVFRHTDAETPTNEDLAREVQRLGGLLLTQHWNWELTDSPAEAALEACAAWRYYIDEPEPFHRELVAGRRLAFIGGSDSHRRNPGTCGALTGLYARELTRDGIFEAIRARRTYATSGSPIALDFRINGEPMGSEIALNGPPKLTVSARGTRPLEKVTIIRGTVGGEVSAVGPMHEASVDGLSATIEWEDTNRPDGTVFYYVVVKQEGEDIEYPSNLATAEGCRAWSSPIWVTQAE